MHFTLMKTDDIEGAAHACHVAICNGSLLTKEGHCEIISRLFLTISLFEI